MATIRNSIVWQNKKRETEVLDNIVNNGTNTISYSLIQGSGGSGGGWVTATGTDGGGNIDTDPLFANTADLVGPDNIWATTDDGLALLPCSPAINTGNNTEIAATDITGSNRLVGPNTDMGAYENPTPGASLTLYQDLDGDGYGNPAVSITGCITDGYVTNSTDCDDTNPEINPATIWHLDRDGDGYADESGAVLQCEKPEEGYYLASQLISIYGDCNDDNAAIHPNGTEVCNGEDDNCNGRTDEGANPIFYYDEDGDGYGDPNITLEACSPPDDFWVADNTDCDDGNIAINPATIWYKDADNDGYSDGTTLTQCTQPAGYKLATALTGTSGDCDDGNASIHPGATELCNGVDDDCDGNVDEECQADPCGSIIGRLYVNAAATASGNGATWLCAIKELRDAVAIANANTLITEIWVAKGIYMTAAGTNRSVSIDINRAGLTIMGGFIGNETSPNQANPIQNITTISGDIGVKNNFSDNSFHVLRILTSPSPNGTQPITVSGMQFEKGNANNTNPGYSEDTYGGAVLLGQYSTNTLVNFTKCAFTENRATASGGAFAISKASPAYTYTANFDSCLFYKNTAAIGGAVEFANTDAGFNTVVFRENNAISGSGGAVYSNAGTINYHRTAFDKNTAINGGAVYAQESSTSFDQSVFNKNTAAQKGGAVYANMGTLSLGGSTALANTAQTGGGAVFADNTTLYVRNSIFWNNKKVGAITGVEIETFNTNIGACQWNMLQTGTGVPADNGGTIKENNRGVNPLFVSESQPAGNDSWFIWQNDGLQLSQNSPAINSGDNATAGSTDILGNPRIQCGVTDKGAYEFAGCPTGKATPPLAVRDEIKARVNSLFTTSLQIHYKGPQKASLTITDLSGRPMTKTSSLPQGVTSINTSNWLGGMYQVVIYYNGKPHVFKVIKGK